MNDKYAKLDKLMTMTLADKLKLVEEIISAPLEEQVISDLNNEGYRLQNVGKKETFLKGAGIFFFALFLTFNSYGQTIDDVAIGAVLASMPTGVTLRDGTVLKAEVISLGTAAASYTNHGIYNQYDFGGIFNGVNDGLTTPTGPDGNTIVGYTGSKDPLNFTRINADPRTDIDRGDATNFGNAIGFHFWSDRPIIAKELLLIDCDGFTGGSNREWFTLFGYNGTTAVNPTISLHTATELVQGLETVNTSWYTLVNSKITGTVASFTQKRIAKNSTGTTGDNDPDDRGIQALFDFGTNKVTDLFVLWGVRGDLGAATGSQNSGVSPLVFSFEFD
ncbi:MAG: hypothetical protein IT256_03020, partial [Chitinophagaceae bacterium]|nr:hypothetical protein [Chitinophagaceae bacterium]